MTHDKTSAPAATYPSTSTVPTHEPLPCPTSPMQQTAWESDTFAAQKPGDLPADGDTIMQRVTK